ncbi:shikimate dehydrogenase [Fulvivirga sp. 29W222]|uniref:Shikimate dehydrogenase n=1 Tax=Fulvivirga marina TaxID=2494733 RepID=A0A937FTW6_9BACT|nr:shikimate dehydrogenase [Fulvivirga marina]MBL6444838.1 shikimate dehydrogenase [Fulvivirga marina]
MSVYGLIGKKLAHSFSKKYFTEKFETEKLSSCSYELFELPTIDKLTQLVRTLPGLAGLNVTIPYKEEVIPMLDEVHDKAREIGAVNVIKVCNGKLTGYNSDYFGFKKSLINWLDEPGKIRALILGTGGASKAVIAALKDLSISYQLVSRNPEKGNLSYVSLKKTPEIIKSHHLIINTTPLGMYPQMDSAPDLDYSLISDKHYLYDLVYNPEITRFLETGLNSGAKVKNGSEMLHLQAEKSWKIWNQR